MIETAVTSAIAAQRALDEAAKQPSVPGSPGTYHQNVENNYGRVELPGIGMGPNSPNNPELELDGSPIQCFEMQHSKLSRNHAT
jgi:hypothetical protein